MDIGINALLGSTIRSLHERAYSGKVQVQPLVLLSILLKSRQYLQDKSEDSDSIEILNKKIYDLMYKCNSLCAYRNREISGSSPCLPGTLIFTNSEGDIVGEYQVNSGEILNSVLPDQNIRIFVAGNLQHDISIPVYSNETINVIN